MLHNTAKQDLNQEAGSVLSFTPGQKIEKKLKDLHGLVVESCGKLEDMSDDEKEYIHHCAFISSIGASTRIENAVLTDQEIDWVDSTLTADGKPSAFEEKKAIILDKLSKDRERSVEEVAGCRDTLATIYLQSTEMVPLSETVIRGLHHELLRYYPAALKYAGSYKDAPNRVVAVDHQTGKESILLDPAPPGIMTDTAMADLVGWYNSMVQKHPWPLLVATEFVFRFLAIHPFRDGNGRLGRALFLLVLLQSDDSCLARIVPYISIDRQIERNRPLYYSVLHQGSDGRFESDPEKYNYEPVTWFLLKIFESALADIAVYRLRYADLRQLSETAMAVLGTFKSNPERRLKVADVAEITGLPRRTIQYALRTLVKKQFLQILGRGAGTRYQLVF